MPSWFSQIRAAQKIESNSHASRWVQLATIGLDNNPRVRTVVFRGWTDEYEMKIYTDKRSQKYHELDVNNNVEICWLFLKSKCQFRFRGTSTLDLSKDKISNWNELSKKSKSMWSWPNPGGLFQYTHQNSSSNNSKENGFDNFVLLKINFTHVDQLSLHESMHLRKRWIRKDKWTEERINP